MKTELSNYEYLEKLRNLSSFHSEYMKESISLIASDNLLSPLAKEMLVSDLGCRYGEGHPGSRFLDEIEGITNKLATKLFKTELLDLRPISGTNANQAVLYAFSKPGQSIATISEKNGAHSSSTNKGTVGMRGLKIIDIPFDIEEMNIKIDEAIKVLKLSKPKIVLVGQSVFLFPLPLRDLSDAIQESGSLLWYDAAHVLGLIAGGVFQDPLREGADIVTGSTHKTMPGPQRGLILGGDRIRERWGTISEAVFPGVLANHHVNTLASLGVTLAEELQFGKSYAKQVIRNAKKLAESLNSLGMKVLGEKNGFTQSHTILMDVKKQGGGQSVSKKLEKANIFVNPYVLPYDNSLNANEVGGLRLGVQEMTRIGMKEADMDEIAEVFVKIILGKLSNEDARRSVKLLKLMFNKVKYCFERKTDVDKFISLYS